MALSRELFCSGEETLCSMSLGTYKDLTFIIPFVARQEFTPEEAIAFIKRENGKLDSEVEEPLSKCMITIYEGRCALYGISNKISTREA